ncbi:uncharacterized protein EI90DRAFT_3117530 [Cantharellus anzutake]|uniref:uncharacterized protein n=1 Tax=Cantharellus anzutake TaxID=1750568 RepID=UPI001907DA5C|nr:uncharacterized protein EI90DRAFT_3117530 [Cantharellus anzutake]KAF8339754.1 hypothetical protein EI90DRAFT_3117530 [Cantharellus anzutake]
MSPLESPSPSTMILLAEYTDTLSSLPNELTRGFSDLRELDAVLRSSIEAITRKIIALTRLLESETATPAERLVLILEIADDAQRLKMGSEDKIRVAGKACEELLHTRTLVNRTLAQIAAVIPHFSETLNVHNTTYPHVAPSSLLPVTGEFGRRKRNPGTSVLHNTARDLYPSISPKKRRLDDDASSIRGAAGSSNGRNVSKGKDANKPSAPSALSRGKPRAGGDTDSISAYDTVNGYGANRSGSRTANGKVAQPPPKANNPRSRTNGDPGRMRGLLDTVASRGGGSRAFEDDDYATTGAGSSRRSPHANERQHGNGNGTRADPDYQAPGSHNLLASTSGPSTLNSHQPSSRAAANRGRATVAAAVAAEDYDLEINGYDVNFDGHGDGYGIGEDGMDEGGDGDGDLDETKYCYCDRVSFGEMVGCDGPDCTREWFHLPCIGLTVAPKGEWFCDECLAKRGAQASNKSQRRSGGHTTNSNATTSATAANSSKSGNGRSGSGGGRRTKNNNRSGNNSRAKSQSATAAPMGSGPNNATSEPGTSNGTDGPGNDGTPSPTEGPVSTHVKDETDVEPSPTEPPEQPDKKERLTQRESSSNKAGTNEKKREKSVPVLPVLVPVPAADTDIDIDPALKNEPTVVPPSSSGRRTTPPSSLAQPDLTPAPKPIAA